MCILVFLVFVELAAFFVAWTIQKRKEEAAAAEAAAAAAAAADAAAKASEEDTSFSTKIADAMRNAVDFSTFFDSA